MPCRLRWRGCMQDQRPHNDSPACADTTCDRCLARGDPGDRIRIEQRHKRPRDHPQRSVVFIARIEMKPHRHHRLQHARRRLHMHHTRLLRPRPKASDVASLAHRDRPILMPRHRPVRSGVLSNRIARTANACGPRMGSTIARTRGSVARSRMFGSSRRLRRAKSAPRRATVLSSRGRESDQRRRRSTSLAQSTLSTTQNPSDTKM